MSPTGTGRVLGPSSASPGPSPGSLGIYIHVPFCLRKCGYCDFFSVPYTEGAARETLAAMKREIAMKAAAPEMRDLPVETVYFGGGTPSLLGPDDIRGLLDTIGEQFPQTRPREITVEVNPATVGERWFGELRSSGVNRISIGIQSLIDRELEVLGRAHTAQEGRRAFAAARKGRFDNVGVDLIYGIPGQDLVSWKTSLGELIDLGPEHVSAYELTVNRETPLGRALGKAQVLLPEEEIVLEMFRIAGTELARAGLDRYEVSNYARPGRESLHNLRYWQRGYYLGIGPAAHSHIFDRRFWNLASLPRYLAALGEGRDPVEGSERILAATARREQILLSLRTAEGVSLDRLGPDREHAVSDLVASGLAQVRRGRLILTDDGLMLADELALRIV